MGRIGAYLRTIGRIAARDAMRIVRNPVAAVILAGVCILPSLYAWYTVSAMWDPYANAQSMKIAVVNEDTGADSQYTGHVNVGNQVVDKLRDDHEMGWQFVDREEGVNRVYSGEYYAAIVLPSDFSEKFISAFSGHFEQPQIDYYVNEKLSGSGAKMADAAADAVEKAINEQFVATVSKAAVDISQRIGGEVSADAQSAEGSLTAGVAEVHSAIGSTRQQLDGLLPAIDTARSSVTQAKDGLAQIQGQLPTLEGDLSAAQDQLSQLRSTIAEYSQKVATETGDVAVALDTAAAQLRASGTPGDAAWQAADALTKAAGELRSAASKLQLDVVAKMQDSLDAFASALATLKGATAAVQPVLSEGQAILAQLDQTLGSARSSAETASASLAGTEQSLDDALTSLRSLQDSSTYGELRTYLSLDAHDVASFMATPVQLNTMKVYPVANYGSGVAPFFTNVALWVGALMMLAVARLRVDPKGLPPFTAVQAYFGRWLLFAGVGLVQGAIVCAGDLVLGIQCANPAAFIGAGMLAAFTYANLMFALAYSMRHVGKALAIILLILQIPGSSGMFPIQMMPLFFQVMNPLLPFTYAIDAMREAIGGFYGLHYLIDMLVLGLVFVPLGLLIGLLVGRYSYNLNLMFDQKLADGGLFNTETAAAEPHRMRVRTVLRALLHTRAYQQAIVARAERFRTLYPKLVRAGWIAIFALPATMFAVLAIFRGGPDEVLLLLTLFIAGIIAVVAYLVVITFMNGDIAAQVQLAKMDSGERAKAAEDVLARKTGAPHA